jgi:hypothetical protein
LSREEAYECRDQFANLAVGSTSFTIQSRPGAMIPNDIRDLSDREYASLLNYLSMNDSLRYSSTLNPSNWLKGTELFLRFFRTHPGMKSIAAKSSTADDELSLENMKRIGQGMATTVTQLALRPDGEGYALKENVFLELLSNYRAQMISALELSEAKSEQFADRGPSPSLQGFNQPIVIDDKISFLEQPIRFCSEGGSVQIGKVSYLNRKYDIDEEIAKLPASYRAHDRDVKPWRNQFSKEKAVADMKDANENHRIIEGNLRKFNPNWFKLDKSFLSLLPKSVVWAVRMGDHYREDVQITPCFSEISIPDYYNGVNPANRNNTLMTINFHIVLDFFMTTRVSRSGARSKPILVSRLVADKRQVSDTYFDRGYYYYPDKSIPFLVNYWIGQTAHEWGHTFNWESVRGHAANHFKIVQLDDNRELREFEAKFDEFLKIRHREASERLNEAMGRSKETGADRILALITVLGLDPVDPYVQKFKNWLFSADGLSSPVELAQMQMDLGLTPADVMKGVDEKIVIAKAKIAELRQSKTLRPRSVQFEEKIRDLKKLR